MGLRSFFHKIRIGFQRKSNPSIPYTDSVKRYGSNGEEEFIRAIQQKLPECKIKKNVMINTLDGRAEIDCLILYRDKLFAIEVKRWKGHLVENGNNFIQYKIDQWTDEIHTKIHKSPFKQLNRAVYLLRKQNPDNAWLNTIVFFEESDHIETQSDNVWFNDIDKLTSYIVNSGKSSRRNNASAFFDKCIAADYLYHHSWGTSFLCCVVCDNSLRFNTPNGLLTKRNIYSISITHHWSYDELKIKTLSGELLVSNLENSFISVIDNGYIKRYALSKIDRIQFGN